MKILLQKIMLERKLTVRQVSIMTGIPKSTIEDIINKKSSPRLETLEKLAMGLNLKITDLFESPYK
ncbi:helix-turn-helix transcriptional regulator [Blautia pseudococcoides]|uniref:helix-turn-helix domain-containing protein n=1 Tax=Blautia pseudococcoides TaxID=1796616 RepID=UPI00148B007E|nr:helix-turn-helix transcriptional regulator [Blautia pseudococcoides]QJU14819.1 helix-turn-helix transcriptional regulator [Blautia pseudococcoides]